MNSVIAVAVNVLVAILWYSVGYSAGKRSQAPTTETSKKPNPFMKPFTKRKEAIVIDMDDPLDVDLGDSNGA